MLNVLSYFICYDLGNGAQVAFALELANVADLDAASSLLRSFRCLRSGRLFARGRVRLAVFGARFRFALHLLALGRLDGDDHSAALGPTRSERALRDIEG